MHEDVPLVVAEVNPEAVEGHHGLIANPNCSTMQMVVALAPIHRAVGIERIVVSTYQSVSGTGQRAIERAARPVARDPARQASRRPRSTRTRSPSTCSRRSRSFKDGDDYTTEERKMMAETRKILGASEDELGISATCVRVPVFVGHSESVNVADARDLSPEACRELLAAAPGRHRRRRTRRRASTRSPPTRRPRRGARRPDPPRPVARALPQPVGRRRQPAQGRGDQRRAGRRAARTSATSSGSPPAPRSHGCEA